jgi:putative Mg2+ transporter-C (MgtC) family protein
MYAQCVLRFARETAASEEDVRQLLSSHHFVIVNLAYGLDEHAGTFEYRMAVRTVDPANMSRLGEAVRNLPLVRGFTLSASGD